MVSTACPLTLGTGTWMAACATIIPRAEASCGMLSSGVKMPWTIVSTMRPSSSTT